MSHHEEDEKDTRERYALGPRGKRVTVQAALERAERAETRAGELETQREVMIAQSNRVITNLQARISELEKEVEQGADVCRAHACLGSHEAKLRIAELEAEAERRDADFVAVHGEHIRRESELRAAAVELATDVRILRAECDAFVVALRALRASYIADGGARDDEGVRLTDAVLAKHDEYERGRR